MFGETLLINIYDSSDKAQQLVERLIEKDFPMDKISMLHKRGGSGDDALGITFEDKRERMRIWGEQGAFWGALGGLLASGTGLFLFPGIGAVLAVGPLVEVLGAAVTGAVVGAGAMAGAAAVTQITMALRKIGIPEEQIEELHDHVNAGEYLVIVHCSDDEADRFSAMMAYPAPVASYRIRTSL